MTNHTDERTRRFSEGMEHLPSLAASARQGSFADGMATTAVTRRGSFADGMALHEDALAARRFGSFGDTEPPAPFARPRPRLGTGRVAPQAS